LNRSQGIRRNGSAALDLSEVACGRIDGYWELRLKPREIAAGRMVVADAAANSATFAASI